MVDNPPKKTTAPNMMDSVILPEMFDLPQISREVILFFNLRYFKTFHKRVNGSKVKGFGPSRRFEWEGKSGGITVLGGMIGAPLAVLIVELAMVSGAEVVYSFGSTGSTGSGSVEIGELIVPEFGYDETGMCRDYLATESFQTIKSKFDVSRCKAITSVNSFFRLTPANINRYRESNIQLIDMEAAPLNHVVTRQGKDFYPLFVVSDSVSDSLEWNNGANSRTFEDGLASGLEELAGL